MFYLEFLSASKVHIDWLRKNLTRLVGVKGHITNDARRITYQLKYAKRESLMILPKLYYAKNIPCLSRKRLKINDALATIGRRFI
jgi:hypothetical protein